MIPGAVKPAFDARIMEGSEVFALFGDRIDRDTGRTLPITYRWPGQP